MLSLPDVPWRGAMCPVRVHGLNLDPVSELVSCRLCVLYVMCMSVRHRTWLTHVRECHDAKCQWVILRLVK